MSRCLLFFITMFFLSLSHVSFSNSLDCQKTKCLAVVDAGSTGSRLHIYNYELDKNNTPINIVEKWSKKVKPGFATLEAKQEHVDSYLTSLFSEAPSNTIPIYFLATGGMRLLPQPKQQQLYNNLKKWFSDKPQWELINARTITGQEEGVFGWLAINYQLGSLTTNSNEVVGVMDMGGASVQIVFPTASELKNSKDIQQIDIYGRHFSLFTHSFLGLGQTELSHQFFDDNTCFPNNYKLANGDLGEGDVYNCSSRVTSLLQNVHNVSSTVQPAMLNNSAKKWYVLGGVVDMVKDKPFSVTGTSFNNQSISELANQEICHQQWEKLNLDYPTNDYLYGYCLFPAYYYALMVNGYGLDPQQTIHFMGKEQASDWTIGVVLHRA